MKCPKCKKELPKNTKFCSYCGTPIKRKSFKAISIVLVIALLLASIGIIGYKFDFFKSNNSIIKSGDFFALNYKFTDKKITSAESAITAVSEKADVLGFNNALDNLTTKTTNTTINGDGFYRLQQNYNGIPVYGRTIVVAADKTGKAISLNANVKDIDSIDTTPKISENEALDIIKQEVDDASFIKNVGLTIYSYTTNNKNELSWQFYVSNENNAEYIFVSATNGEIIEKSSLVFTDIVQGSGIDIDNNAKTFNTEFANNTYTLTDTERNISVYDTLNGTLIAELDDNGNIVLYSMNKKAEKSKIDPLTSQTETWIDAKAVTTINRIAESYNYFSTALGRKGFNGNNGMTYVSFNNFNASEKNWSEGDTTNAYSKGAIGNSTILSFGTDNSMSYDVFGHEYTHSVEQSISALQYKGESGAIMEACSDIFGELIEQYCTQNCDWEHGEHRNLINPENNEHWVCSYEMNGQECPVKAKSKDGKHQNYNYKFKENKYCVIKKPYPNTYKGDGWLDASFMANDNGGVHTNCTVLSHAGYLMWYGINGDSKKNLNEQELAELWYRSILMFPSDCTFAVCRTIVEMSAEQIGLSNYQRKCISEAFDKVGIGRTNNITYLSKNKFELTVNDINGNPYDKYTLSIDDEKTLDNISIPQSIELKNGHHTLTLKDKENENKTYSFTVNVSEGEDTRDYITINSDFGKLKDETKQEENINKELEIDPSYPTTYNESSMKYQRMVAKDENYTFMKDLNGKLERKNNDGSAGDKVLYDKEFFTICGIDASYIYLLKGSEKDGVYDIVRISKDGKKTDTLLQSINWCLHMDSDYFYYVPSDNNKCIRRLNRAKITSDNYCEFNEPVEVLIPQDNNFMVVTKEDSIFAFFGGATNNFYLIDKTGATIKEYGSEITVEEYPREKNDEGGYNTAIKYVSNGYLRSTAAEVHLQYGGSFINAEGISGWNPTKNGIVTTLNNDVDEENALPYRIMLYDATSGESKKMTEVHSNQAFFTMCQDDNGDWCYIDEVDNKLILYSLSSNLGSKEIITEIDAGKFNCSLETCGMEIMDNRIYFYSMPDNKTANAIYRYDLILED